MYDLKGIANKANKIKDIANRIICDCLERANRGKYVYVADVSSYVDEVSCVDRIINPLRDEICSRFSGGQITTTVDYRMGTIIIRWV